ncbi:DUF6152 family protein [Curvibacter sp. PAE-UM]|uniref:DUF6152 family protein n=1 Tax=Curvibacter sp. PAE-UM TaxID=1714344 RepID=UPI0007111727|nr:DUF6152 family protein [Curvibacter sp. PAE-UM]KRI00982.1 hypothetical protein AO057_10235 [Curvibacter sp. PAE-UM]
MKRRTAISLALLPGLLPLARAHHGWSSFDQERPLYLQGRVHSVRWQNPHAELVLELQSPLTLPPDLAQRALPAQTAPVDGKALLARAQLPRRKDPRWEIELAPLTRMQAWNVTPLKVGDAMGVLGFAFQEEKGAAILRAEYLFVGARIYGLRSSPA